MRVYREKLETIMQTQYHDPLLNHLSQKITAHLALSRGTRLLDIGCGVGRIALLAASKGFTVVGIDIEKKAIDLAKANAKKLNLHKLCTFIRADILRETNLSKEKFDVVICSEVIEHVSDHQNIVRTAFKLLRKGGLLILTTPHDQKLWSVLDEYAGHVKRFRTKEIKSLLSDFEIIHIYTVGFPIMRSIIKLYSLFTKITERRHTASWRERKMSNRMYAFLVSLLLKFDDLFNFTNKGTTIIAVARK